MSITPSFERLKKRWYSGKSKKSKVFWQEGFTFAIFRVLYADYQQFTQGETPPKNRLVFTEGFTSLYHLIISLLYP